MLYVIVNHVFEFQLNWLKLYCCLYSYICDELFLFLCVIQAAFLSLINTLFPLFHTFVESEEVKVFQKYTQSTVEV